MSRFVLFCLFAVSLVWCSSAAAQMQIKRKLDLTELLLAAEMVAEAKCPGGAEMLIRATEYIDSKKMTAKIKGSKYYKGEHKRLVDGARLTPAECAHYIELADQAQAGS